MMTVDDDVWEKEIPILVGEFPLCPSVLMMEN